MNENLTYHREGDWSLFPTLTLPRMEKRHFSAPTGEALFMRKMMETRRMEYTIYNALGSEPEAWDEYHDGAFICTRYLVLSL